MIIATAGSNIGMGGPAMIEGGGLGRLRARADRPERACSSRNGVIDVLVEDEARCRRRGEPVPVVLPGARPASGSAPTRGRCAMCVPENRLRSYDVRAVMRGVADTGSLLELRAGFGAGIVTALARIEGRPVGLLANNPPHLGGAIDVEAADKAARFMQLCNAHGLPLVSAVRHAGFHGGARHRGAGPGASCEPHVHGGLAPARCRVFAVVLRKGYGLGAHGDDGGRLPRAGVHRGLAHRRVRRHGAGRCGAPGLPQGTGGGARGGAGAMRCSSSWWPSSIERGEAMNMARALEIDAVIDPADTRRLAVARAGVGEGGAGRVTSGRHLVTPRR